MGTTLHADCTLRCVHLADALVGAGTFTRKLDASRRRAQQARGRRCHATSKQEDRHTTTHRPMPRGVQTATSWESILGGTWAQRVHRHSHVRPKPAQSISRGTWKEAKLWRPDHEARGGGGGGSIVSAAEKQVPRFRWCRAAVQRERVSRGSSRHLRRLGS